MLRDYTMYTAFNWIDYIDRMPHSTLAYVIDKEGEPYPEYLGFSGFKSSVNSNFSLEMRKAVGETDDKDGLRTMLRTFVKPTLKTG